MIQVAYRLATVLFVRVAVPITVRLFWIDVQFCSFVEEEADEVVWGVL